jgi:hypothetical protein
MRIEDVGNVEGELNSKRSSARVVGRTWSLDR